VRHGIRRSRHVANVSPRTEVAAHLARLFASRPAALFTDFDGTLSPVAPAPDLAEAAPGARDTLALLSDRIDLVGIVTGRGLDDVRGRIGIDDLLYVGNHGLESWSRGQHTVHPAGLAAEAALPEALRDINQRLQAQVSTEGVIFEDKRYSGSVHFRLSPEQGQVGAALAPIVEEVAREYGFWVSGGKMVYELRPGAEVNKGSAVRAIIEEQGIRSAVFLGDDVTDADAFKVLRQLREEQGIPTCSVGVLTLDTAQPVIDYADFLLDGVDDVVAMLLELSELLTREAATSPERSS
jgi:trehalose 6-phosphate phosphatase